MAKISHLNNQKLIQALLEAPETFLAELKKQTGKDFLNPEDIVPYITFTTEDVLTHIRVHKLERTLLGHPTVSPTKTVYRAPGTSDGRYVVSTGDHVEVYDQERGGRIVTATYATEADALAALEQEYAEAKSPRPDAIEAFVTARLRMIGVT